VVQPTFVARHGLAVTRFREELSRVPAEGYTGCCDAVAGGQDPFVSVGEAKGLADALPDAHCAVLPDAGDLVPVEAPGRLARLVVDHLCVAAGGRGGA
jgi:3-oxoadipate enol-lactonase